MLVLDKVAKNEIRTEGIAMIQDITRPLGIPIQHSSIPFQNSIQGQTTMQNMDFLKDRMKDILKMADEMQIMIDVTTRQAKVTHDLASAALDSAKTTQETSEITDTLRDHIADFEDFYRPIRSYFYWEKHCYDIPACFALRNTFEALDSIDELAEKFEDLTTSLDKLDAIQPQLVGLIPPQIASQEVNQELVLKNFATNSGIAGQSTVANDNPAALGQAFDKAKNDDLFYLPPEVFTNPDFQRGLKLFVSPDGKAARLIITHEGDPAEPAAISRVEPIKLAAHEAVKNTPLAGASFYLGGTASTYKDIGDMNSYDLLIVAIASLSLILLIMMIITRSLVAAIVIVGTVALSLGASFGLSVLLWQYMLGIKLYWVVLALAVILLLAVGSDYNLLLISRFKEEIHAGLKTGIIRAMAGSGSVVTAAGLVFAVTMCGFVFSGLQTLGQIGTTIGLGLLFDTLIVRSFMTPSIATLLGRWFWWPQRVRPRPASRMLQPYGSRAAVRQLLLWDDPEESTVASG
jgi:RND superfamily putative drug exporter